MLLVLVPISISILLLLVVLLGSLYRDSLIDQIPSEEITLLAIYYYNMMLTTLNLFKHCWSGRLYWKCW